MNMKRRALRTTLAGCATVLGLLAASSSAAATTVAVDARSNIYGAGHAAAPAPGGGGAGVLPPEQDLPPGTGRALTFSSVTGGVTCTTGAIPNGPDGGCFDFTGTNLFGFGGISRTRDLTAGHNMFLVGVFLTDAEPVVEPDWIEFTSLGHDFLTLSPQIAQVFFIGDGRTGDGTTQRFDVPDAATRLFLGFADGPSFIYAAGYYDDNSGTLSATFNVSGSSPPDTTPSDTAIDTGPAEGSTSSSNDPAFTYHELPAGDVDHFECKLDNDTFATCPSAGQSYSDVADGTHTFAVRTIDAAGNADQSPATRTWTVDTAAPATTIDSGPAEGSTIAGTSASLVFSSPAGDVARFECRLDAASYATCSSPQAYGSLADGSHTFRVRAVDIAGNTGPEATRGWIVSAGSPPPAYPFAGFFSPVDNQPTLNLVKAGQSVPVKFSLGGDRGLGILAPGSPKSETVACSTTAPVDGIDQTVTAGSSSLSYDAASDTYTYVWKTDKAWAGSCRQLVVKLDDGSVHRGSFKFK